MPIAQMIEPDYNANYTEDYQSHQRMNQTKVPIAPQIKLEYHANYTED